MKSTTALANIATGANLESTTNPREVMALPHRAARKWPAPKLFKPDYTNQLDLFGDTSIALATVEEANEPPAKPDTPVLAHSSAGDADRTQPQRQDRRDLTQGGEASDGPPVRIPLSPETRIHSGLGADDAGDIVDAESERKPSRDFRIGEYLKIGQGSLHQKALENIAAIRVLKQLEAEDREATQPEKEILSKYVGWGAMSAAFDRYPPQDWKFIAEALKRDLTEDEYESARASTPNAHFTSPLVIGAIWEGMKRLGLPKDAAILEPSMGVGHFFGMMPDDLATEHRTGIELDSITARIAQKLYPDVKIFAKGFEETPLPDNYFDAVIGNVPFGNYAVHDPSYKRGLTRAIHDYFFAKSLDKLRPGGVMALITSRYTMDKQDESVRAYLDDGAELIGAIRLPNTAFKGNAGTEVTTDILFLRKRSPGAAPNGQQWRKLRHLPSQDGPIEVNEYFAHHPKMMLGKLRLEGTMYRDKEPTLEGELTPQLLDGAIKALPQGVFIPRDRERPPPPQILEAEAFEGVKEGAFAERDGQLFIRAGNSFEPANISASSATRVKGMMAVRDAVRYVFKTQLEDAPEHEITEARRILNRMYDAFVNRHGPLSSRENLRAFAGDPDHPLLLSLEHYDPETKRAKKAAIFSQRTLEKYKPAQHVETAAEALAISLNEIGAIRWPRMTSLTGHSEKQLQRELDGMVYKNPSGDWETADKYLSGNVRDKLKIATSAAELDPSYTRNVEALREVQPPDLMPGDISARLGSSWIPASDVQQFISELLNVPKSEVKVTHSGAIATWSLELDWTAKTTVANTTTFGTNRVKASELIEDALNGRTPTVYDQLDKAQPAVQATRPVKPVPVAAPIAPKFVGSWGGFVVPF